MAARKDSTSGELKNCSVIRAVFADIDFKDTPEDKARRALDAFPLRSSFLVESGGGFHCYWVLKEPIVIVPPAEDFKALCTITKPSILLLKIISSGGISSGLDAAKVYRFSAPTMSVSRGRF